jgi:hypothetical protein
MTLGPKDTPRLPTSIIHQGPYFPLGLLSHSPSHTLSSQLRGVASHHNVLSSYIADIWRTQKGHDSHTFLWLPRPEGKSRVEVKAFTVLSSNLRFCWPKRVLAFTQ